MRDLAHIVLAIFGVFAALIVAASVAVALFERRAEREHAAREREWDVPVTLDCPREERV